MITTKTPLRITFAGGVTDVPSFYKKFGGWCVNATIDKYVTVTLRECLGHPMSLHSNIVRAGLEMMDIRDVYVEVEKDISVHGLGTSSAICVGLLKAIYDYTDQSFSPSELAANAFHLEREILDELGGKQDHYAAAHGGMNFLEFGTDGTVVVNPQVNRFQSEDFMLFDIGVRPRAHDGVYRELDYESILITKDLVKPCLHGIQHGLVEYTGNILSAAWHIKKQIHPSVSSAEIDDLYYAALDAGAYGGKLLGGGGGGCFLFAVPRDKRDGVCEALDGYTHIPFNFEKKGSHIYERIPRSSE